MMNKIEFRKYIKQIKKNISEEEKLQESLFVFQQLENDSLFLNSQNILIYWALNDEVQTSQFINKWSDKKQFILPVINGDLLDFKCYKGIDSLKSESSFGIMQPEGDLFLDHDKIQLIVIPGVAFDKNGNRLGRGKGFYDKFLKSSKAMKIGVCFSFQYFDEVPFEEHDVKMDKVIVGERYL